jgi:Ca2+-binding EF-hand superfamily protein
MIIFFVANIGFAEDAPKTGCAKQACFDRMDADKNGQVTETEFLESRKNCFSSLDTDKNGSLSKDELKSCCMKTMPEKGKECPYMKNKMKK